MKNPLVSIIIPTFNVHEYVGAAIESVIEQTYDNWELLIVDDASADDTIAVVEGLVGESGRVRVFRLEKNVGAGAARNVGIREARGRYIAFLDADDWWYPTKLEEQVRFIQENDIAFSFTAFEYADNALNVTGVSHKPPKISYCAMLIGNNIGTPGVMIDTQAVGKMYMPSLRESEDWALWIAIVRKAGAAYSINLPLWKYRDHTPQNSRRKMAFLKANYRVYREIVGVNGLTAVLMLLFVFVPCQILKVLFNKVDSWRYMRDRSRLE